MQEAISTAFISEQIYEGRPYSSAQAGSITSTHGFPITYAMAYRLHKAICTNYTKCELR